MKVIFALLAMVAAVAVARPQEQLVTRVIPILSKQYTRDDFGQYASSYLSGDGTRVIEQGALVPNNEGTGHVIVSQGSFEYYAPDGTLINVKWTADTDGFHPEGSHLPTTPASI